MSDDFQLNAMVRNDMGKGASRRLRREANLVPAIIYGGEKAPENISIVHNELDHALQNEAFYSHIITLKVDGAEQDVILKDVQRHPSKPVVLHADFLRVSKTQKLHTKVPLHFVNEETCTGVKMGGGIISHNMTELDISCLPADLPEYIEVDVSDVELGGVLHISDIKMPSGVESVALSHGEEHDLPIFTVNKPKGGAEATEEEAGEEGGEEGSAEE
ncbi:MAG: 50S ribosomal protein L25/general stress protein Ctc [Gammaproteobacteria bacterium]|nr:MAG: 50S ribosomal protein L25/general stress protein Ctc [Gammaproteobacteria bacterium]